MNTVKIKESFASKPWPVLSKRIAGVIMPPPYDA